MNIHRTRKTSLQSYSALLILVLFLNGCVTGGSPGASSTLAETDVARDVQVSITGGYELDPRDGGRPVVLIAAALGVPEDVFREAFSHVQPAGAGEKPDSEQVALNKKALLSALGPYGVNNERLDEVSNYYRYNGNAGETWPRTPATAMAIVENGVVTGFIITNAGSGYTSAPVISLSGSDATATATISFSTDFNTNGALTAITLAVKEP